MNRLLVIFSILLAATVASAKVRVAVIDTGYTKPDNEPSVPLCESGHLDLTSPDKQDVVGRDNPEFNMHGTNVAHIIASYAGSSSDYCLVIIKAFSKNSKLINSALGIEHAASLGVDVINYSGGGYGEEPRETASVKKALNLNILFVAAAGNQGFELKDGISYYPAMSDSRVIAVGSLNKDGERLKSSNYGDSVKNWEIGDRVYGGGVYLTGTSQATAIKTGKIVRQIVEERKKRDEVKSKSRKNSRRNKNANSVRN